VCRTWEIESLRRKQTTILAVQAGCALGESEAEKEANPSMEIGLRGGYLKCMQSRPNFARKPTPMRELGPKSTRIRTIFVLKAASDSLQ
jgi:hypothetical protein